MTGTKYSDLFETYLPRAIFAGVSKRPSGRETAVTPAALASGDFTRTFVSDRAEARNP
jgi:hypothetical protein